MLEHLFYLFICFECSGIQVFNLLTCELWDTMPCHWSLTLTKESEDFRRGGNHSKHMPLLTCQYCKNCTCGKNYDKKYRAAAKLISNHEKHKAVATLISSHNLQNNCSFKNAFQNISALQNCSLKKCISKTWVHIKIVPSKNTFQTISANQNCTLKKCISKLLSFLLTCIKIFL